MELQILHDLFLFMENWNAIILSQYFAHFFLLCFIFLKNSRPSDPYWFHHRVPSLQIKQMAVQNTLGCFDYEFTVLIVDFDYDGKFKSDDYELLLGGLGLSRGLLKGWRDWWRLWLSLLCLAMSLNKSSLRRRLFDSWWSWNFHHIIILWALTILILLLLHILLPKFNYILGWLWCLWNYGR